uniref:Odorant-binding protein 6 n=1 Tax=Chouioia cunea TaxID=1570515 RepID=A0A6B9CIG2_9HYME|nr:odorant-binding protein 6 [Chouioia cunea]
MISMSAAPSPLSLLQSSSYSYRDISMSAEKLAYIISIFLAFLEKGSTCVPIHTRVRLCTYQCRRDAHEKKEHREKCHFRRYSLQRPTCLLKQVPRRMDYLQLPRRNENRDVFIDADCYETQLQSVKNLWLFFIARATDVH